MATTMLILSVDGGIIEHPLELPERPGLDKLRALVEPYLEGGQMEHVTVLYHDARCDMFVDEVGAVKGLPVNHKATRIYRANWLSQHPGADPESLPAVYGPAVLFDRQVWW